MALVLLCDRMILIHDSNTIPDPSVYSTLHAITRDAYCRKSLEALGEMRDDKCGHTEYHNRRACFPNWILS